MALALQSPSAQAGAVVSGTVISQMGGTFAGGAGASFMLPGDTLWVGLNDPGQLTLDGGSLLRVGMLSMAQNGGRTVPADGVSRVLATGAGTRIELDGGNGGSRLVVGEWGEAELTVSGGATLDGRVNPAACGAQGCNTIVGNGAGSMGTFTVSGSNSSASLLRYFVVGSTYVSDPVQNGFSLGTPGGVTHAYVNVLAGGQLTTDSADFGLAPGGAGALGTERSFSAGTVDGPGSVWRIVGATLDNLGANLNLSWHANATASLDVKNGGQVLIQGKTGLSNSVNVGSGGGRGDLRVNGAGSQLLFTGDGGILKIGRNGSTAGMVVDGGALASGMYYLNVGRDGGSGELTVDGAGSRVRVDGTATAAANGGTANTASMDIGRNGTGVVTVSNGGRLELVATTSLPQGTAISLGREAGSSGTLNIQGAGSTVSISSASTLPGGGAAEALNPLVRIGRDGQGFLNISNGGLLWLDGQAVSTVANSRSTSLFIGGSGDATAGGHGIAVVTGAGSEIRVTGNDGYIGVGHGPQSWGQLTVADQALVSAIGMNVGRSGGVGNLFVDHATLSFSGQQTGGTLSGAYFTIGRSGGNGTATITNGSQVTLTNPGNLGASINLGGSATGPGGYGSLVLTGGSHISVQAAFGLGSVSVARDDHALMTISGGSSLDVANGGAVFIGRLGGSSGALSVSDGSSVTAGWVGVGRSKASAGAPSVDGGIGLLIVNDTSTVTANNIVIGSQGYVSGNGTLIGAVTNYGVLAPGLAVLPVRGDGLGLASSSMRIDGSFAGAAGSRIVLDVQDDGSGGFLTSGLVFGNGTALDLSQTLIQFHFLGDTDPNAFQASGGFKVDSFFQALDAGGASHGVDPQAFAGATFAAQADAYVFTSFNFTASGGAVFAAQPVPEPGAAWMVLAGLLAVAGVVRRHGANKA